MSTSNIFYNETRKITNKFFVVLDDAMRPMTEEKNHAYGVKSSYPILFDSERAASYFAHDIVREHELQVFVAEVNIISSVMRTTDECEVVDTDMITITIGKTTKEPAE